MATIRAVGGTESLSLSNSWKDYFLCCFVRTNRSGQRVVNRSPSGPPSGGITDYGSRKSEYVQVIHRSPADDEYSDCDESRANIGREGERQNSRADDTFSSLPTESRERPKITITTDNSLTSAADSNDSSSRRFVKSKQDGQGSRTIEEEGEMEEEHLSSVPLSAAEDSAVSSAMAGMAVSAAALAVSTVAALAPESSVVGLKHDSSSGHDTLDSNCLFDTSDLQSDKSSSSSPCGSIRLTLAYNDTRELMTVTVHEAHNIPSQERGGANQTQVRMLLLPARKIRQKTKVKSGENPHFEEVLDFRVLRDDVSSTGLRIRLYGCERFRREYLIGETIFPFSSINTVLDSSPQTTWVNLEPRNSLSHCDSLSDVSSLAPSECSSSNLSLQHVGTPELMIGLAYNATTGRLSVEIIKGSNFRNIVTKRRPDTYVKMTLTAPNGEEMTNSKTSVRRGQSNPLFKEMFVFQVAQLQLPDVSLLVSVFAQRSLKRKDTIGWFTIGKTSSSEEEQGHWNAMINSDGEQVCRWHALLEA